MNMLCPKCQISQTIPAGHSESIYVCSSCKTSFPLPQICPHCQYFNRAGLQKCFQCKMSLQVASKQENSPLPCSKNLQEEIRKQFVALAQALFILGLWTSIYSVQKLQFTFLFYVLLWSGVAFLMFGCFRQWWLFVVLLLGGTVWLFTQYFEIFWRPELWNYGFACGFLLIFLLSANLLYLWITTTKTTST